MRPNPSPVIPSTVIQQRVQKVPYQICHHLLHVLGAFFHFILGPSELDDVTFLRWVWKVDDNLQQIIGRLSLMSSKMLNSQVHITQLLKSDNVFEAGGRVHW